MDMQEAKDLKSSMLWQRLEEEIDKKILYESMKLRSCSPDELGVIQACIKGLESAKRIPDNIIESESQ